MMYVTPVVSVFEKNRMKKENCGPRAETLMLIRHFARIYEYNPGQRQKARKFLVN